jgi:hypothetical protein
MPEISRFLGIVIAIYYQDHEPLISTPSMEVIEQCSPLRSCSLSRVNYQDGL